MQPHPFQPGLSPRQHTTLMALGLLAFMAALMLVADPTLAGTGGSEFNPLYTKLSDWMTGYLGRVVAAVFIIVGLVAGVTRGSVMGFVFGVAAGTGLFLAPNVIDATVSATLPLLA
ncbi:MAG: pili assembly chaperone [Lamprocystis purpurea]|jgi:conjugal transfer pilus assembly protein TraA|uniref:TraA family conjugative transfer protein n=1 Tax=Lamprocystis purpurea TaxID=61598 RepID=UPI0003627480|nr:TraA family conjugative transfer protein [Lamprocystis purpurea]MBV5272385.1 pili assembly chaperone [Lamprocystis purpurea]